MISPDHYQLLLPSFSLQLLPGGGVVLSTFKIILSVVLNASHSGNFGFLRLVLKWRPETPSGLSITGLPYIDPSEG